MTGNGFTRVYINGVRIFTGSVAWSNLSNIFYSDVSATTSIVQTCGPTRITNALRYGDNLSNFVPPVYSGSAWPTQL
jgi:hypothetical protein